jgi:hypothetical protein
MESKLPGTSRRDFMAVAGAIAATALGESTTLPDAPKPAAEFEAVRIPEWVRGVTRMAFLTPGEVDRAARAGAQVVHTNLIWPYFPLRRDGGGLNKDAARKLRELVERCHAKGMKLVLGLPPFPSVECVRKHPDWRVQAGDKPVTAEPKENDLGSRLGCNLGPWGDFLIEICGELIEDFHLDGYSFDGNYHPALCKCGSCKAAYRKDHNRDLPTKANLDDITYREYLVWRGERLEDHYRRLQLRIKKANPDAVLMSWTTNAGRYGHFLFSPRSMPTRLNRLFDLPMQEWWLDESNIGGSLAPSFGAAYLRAVTGDRPCASEPYLMSRGNPYGTDSFPVHERLTRALLATTYGSTLAMSFGWPGHDPAEDFRVIAQREKYLTRTSTLPWAAMLVSEQTRQFYAYKDIPDRFLAPLFGGFRAAVEEHLPLQLINDWDLTEASLARFAVLLLPNSAALSDAQVAAIRVFVAKGGGLIASGDASLCDELGRPRSDFALADLFGVSFKDRSKTRNDVARLNWTNHLLVRDSKLQKLVPGKSAIFRGPHTLVSEPKDADEVALRMLPSSSKQPLTAVIARPFGKGRVVYFAAGIDAANWSYSYPYYRRLLASAIEWAAGSQPPVRVVAPMCVQATYFTQQEKGSRRLIVHLFNGIDTTANHGLPASDVPLREEIVPIHGIRIRFRQDVPKQLHLEPGGKVLEAQRDGNDAIVNLSPLEIHAMLVGEM